LGTALLVSVCAATAAAWQGSEPAPPPQPDSLAEAARKAKAKKAAQKARKVYNEEDLSGLRTGTISVVGEESVPASSEESKEGEAKPVLKLSPESAGGERDEAYWRGRAQKLREQMALLDAEIEKLKDQIEKTGGVGYDPQSGLSENVIYVHDLNAQLKSLEKRREELQAQMDALLEEARKADVPPGWLR
jgi:chromosome segregation ATPase